MLVYEPYLLHFKSKYFTNFDFTTVNSCVNLDIVTAEAGELETSRRMASLTEPIIEASTLMPKHWQSPGLRVIYQRGQHPMVHHGPRDRPLLNNRLSYLKSNFA